MTEYLLINCFISIWALLTQHFLLKDASHRFTLLMIALLCWLVPFGWFAFSTEVTVITQTQPILAKFTQPVQALVSQPEMNIPWYQILMALMSLGLLAFFVDFWSLHKQHRHFMQKGQATAHQNIFTIKGLNNACVTGFKPSIIWVDEDLYHSSLQTSIVTHEQQHIKQKDPYWLLLITFMQRLFWFNPLVHLLAKQSQITMELKCDQACKQKLSQNLYQNQMAEILLSMQNRKMPLNNYMAQSTKDHIHRIKQLSKETHMKKHHKWLLTLSFSAISILSAGVLANEKINTDTNELDIKINWKFTDHRAGIDQTSEVDSVITVNDKEYTTFGPLPQSQYTLKVKAQRFNPGKEPKSYLISTEIIHDKAFKEKGTNKPAIATFIDEPAIIRIKDDNQPNLHMVELTFTPLETRNTETTK